MIYVLMTSEFEILHDGSIVNEFQDVTLFSDISYAHKAMMDTISSKVSTIYSLFFNDELALDKGTNITVDTNYASVEFNFGSSTQKFRCSIFKKDEIQ